VTGAATVLDVASLFAPSVIEAGLGQRAPGPAAASTG
jgi:hypothetical protein